MHQGDDKQTRRRLKSSQIGPDQAGLLMPTLAALAVAALVALASRPAQLAAAEPAGSGGQQLAESSIGSQAYSSLLGADGPLGQILGRRPLRNSKRARKMTFMPMRGRKDGRDEQQQQLEGALAAVEEQLLAAASKAASQGAFREGPADGDASIMRLVSAQLAGSPSGQAGELAWRGQPTAAPQQFLARHLQQHQQRQQHQQQPEVEGGESLFGLGAPAEPATRMQAKLRRAFHPMRGKKADASLGLLASELADQDEPDSYSD